MYNLDSDQQIMCVWGDWVWWWEIRCVGNMSGVFIWELSVLVRDTNCIHRKSWICWFQQL